MDKHITNNLRLHLSVSFLPNEGTEAFVNEHGSVFFVTNFKKRKVGTDSPNKNKNEKS